MAVITPSTFDPLLAYVNVRLQQGVPIVDADFNEQDDIRKFELRAFLKWYVGDGVPHGNDGFRIFGTGLTNDFVISAGVPDPVPAPPSGTPSVDVGLRHVGRCVVDGLDVLIQGDMKYSEQPLLPGGKLDPPTADHQVLVYLDVWERLVTPTDEDDLIHSGLGVETCARVRREWVVRTVVGTTLPKPSTGHAFFPLANIRRWAKVEVVAANDVDDLRQRTLLMSPAHLLTDVLGVVDPFEYRRGKGRPPVSLREAINALLVGQLPATPDMTVTDDVTGDDLTRQTFLADTTGVVAVWQSPRTNNLSQIYASRFDFARTGIDGRFPPASPVTAGTVARSEPTAVMLPNGEIVVAYQTGPSGSTATRVVMKRGTLGGLVNATEQAVGALAGATESMPYAVLAGDYVVFFFLRGTVLYFRRYLYTTANPGFADSSDVTLVGNAMTDFHASTIPGGRAWIAFRAGGDLQVDRIAPTVNGIGRNPAGIVPGASATSLKKFSILGVDQTRAYAFFADGSSLKMSTYSGTSWSTTPTVVPGTDGTDDHPYAVREPSGIVSLFYQRAVSTDNVDIFTRRWNEATGEWSDAWKLVSTAFKDQTPYPIYIPDQGTWILFQSNRQGLGTADLYAKRIINRI